MIDILMSINVRFRTLAIYFNILEIHWFLLLSVIYAFLVVNSAYQTR